MSESKTTWEGNVEKRYVSIEFATGYLTGIEEFKEALKKEIETISPTTPNAKGIILKLIDTVQPTEK